MANTANLRGYLSDLANSIRHVSGINTNIPANEYDLIINNFILSNETNLEITPSTVAQNFGAPAGYSGYNSINVAAVTNSIDSNITPANLVNGVNILGVVGTFSGDANVVSNDIISGKIAYGNGQQIVGTMNNIGDINITPNIASQLLDAGFYNSINVLPVTANIDNNITPENIVNGVNILGVTGNYQGQIINNQDKTVTENGTYTADEGYTGLGEVTVEVDSIPDEIFIQEDIPTKTTSEALWLKRADESGVLNSNLFDLNDDVFGNRKWSWFINALTNAGYLEDFNKCKNVFIFRGQTRYSIEVFAADKIYINENGPSEIRFYGLGTTIYFKTSDWSTYIYKAENGSASSTFYSGLNASNYYSLDAIYRYNNGYTTNIILPKNQPIQNPEDGIYVENNNVKSIVYVDKGTGTGFTKILDTSKADATANDILEGKTAFVNNTKLTGAMANNGALNITPSTSQQIIPAGYTSGGTVAAVTANIDENITATNIKKGVTILGVTGILEFEDPTPLFASIEEMEAAVEDYPENTLCIVYSDDYLGTYEKQSGEWVLLSVETDGYKVMNILNLIDLVPDDYDGYGGTEEEIMAVLNQIG